jgi:hypothetical protein
MSVVSINCAIDLPAVAGICTERWLHEIKLKKIIINWKDLFIFVFIYLLNKDNCCWLLVAGCLLLVACCWLLVAGC